MADPRSLPLSLLFWVGGCAAFAFAPLISAYVFKDFVPSAKGRTPIESALMMAMLGGLWMLIPAALFRHGQSRQDRNALLERRPMAEALALFLGLATVAFSIGVPQNGLLTLVIWIAAPLASARLAFRTPK